MNRREWLSRTTVAAPAALPWFLAGPGRGTAAQPAAGKLDALKITDVKTILTAPANIRLIVVKVMTSEPGLYGLGCATFTQRARAVDTAVDKYLKPFLIGKNPLQIEDLWQSNFLSSYWHASGQTFEDVEKAARALMEQGQRHVRVQVAVPGLSTYGAAAKGGVREDGTAGANARPQVWEPRAYVRTVPKLFEHLRKQLGDGVELLHDVHERVPPILAMQLAKDLEKFNLFFLEDPFSPEDVGYFEKLRPQTSTPIAMGELFNNPNEWVGLVSNRLIDFIRIHISQVGGLTMARKVATLCEFFAVRTAWHGPGDVSPVGHAANVHLDLAVPNFGIQEARVFTQAEQDVFPGCPVLKDGYYWANDKPGLGIDLDEQLAAKFPISDDPPFDFRWGNVRKKDGTVVKP
jgi:mannonate dehydratase